jgi:aryl-alcohol dehydrogenase-like predicted oxidoreductase
VETIIDRSLKRLGVERLDLVQFHWWDYEVPGYVETALILKDLQAAGKIRLIGTTNFDVPHLKTLTEAGVPVVTNQIQYSLFDRRPEHGLIDFCAETGTKLLCYGSIAGGFISERWIGKERPSEYENRSLVKYALIIDEFGGWDAFQELLSLLGSIAAKHQVKIPNIAQAWVLSRPEVAAVIVGVRSARHVTDAGKTFTVVLDNDDYSRIDAFLAAHPGAEGDTYGLERIKGGRHASILKTNLSNA